jgi:EmrB/QacA subfamily drug resistance transporter
VPEREADPIRAPERGRGPSQARQARYAWRVLTVTSLGAILTGLNTSTLDVALPAVARHFRASPTQASWFLLSYMLVNTVLILVFGRLADLAGRRRLYLGGLVFFTAASLGCGLAPSAGALIGMRVAQGMGAAAIITNTTALLTDAFPPRLLSTGLGANVSVVSAAQLAGPIVGGALVRLTGWRAVFLFNVPVGLLGILWASITLRRTAPPALQERFDVPGAVLSMLSLSGLVVALAEGGALGWSSAPVLAGVTVLLFALPAFLLVQVRRTDPLLDLRLFDDRERAMAYLSNFLLAVARFSLVLLTSLFLQAAQGLDAFAAGLRVTPVAFGIGLASPVSGRLARRHPVRLLASAGMALAAAGLFLLATTLSADAPYPLLGVGLLAVGLGTGMFMTPNTSSIMAGAPADRRGAANGVRSMLQNTGFLVSTALTLALITSPLSAVEKRAAYAGTLSRLPGGDLQGFVGSARLTLFVLAALCLTGIAASLGRGRRAR